MVDAVRKSFLANGRSVGAQFAVSNAKDPRMHPSSTGPSTKTERRLLRKLPWILFFGTTIPLGWALAARQFAVQPLSDDAAKQLLSVDIYAIALVGAVWMGVLTVAVGCAFVLVMKGPRRQADSYEIPPERPEKNDQEH